MLAASRIGVAALVVAPRGVVTAGGVVTADVDELESLSRTTSQTTNAAASATATTAPIGSERLRFDREELTPSLMQLPYPLARPTALPTPCVRRLRPPRTRRPGRGWSVPVAALVKQRLGVDSLLLRFGLPTDGA